MRNHDKEAQYWVNNPDFPAITEQEECHIEKQFLELWQWLKYPAMFLFCVASISSWILFA